MKRRPTQTNDITSRRDFLKKCAAVDTGAFLLSNNSLEVAVVAKRRYEMRCVQNKQYGYIYNAWSDGETVFKNESQSGLTMNAMEEAAATDPDIDARVQLFLYRVPEELHNFAGDPDALHNLVDDPAHKDRLADMREELLAWMVRVEDPLEETFRDFIGSG